MTSDEILVMEAGPEMDKLIAEKIMQSKWVNRYSTDIRPAWDVLEKFTDAEISKAGNGYLVSVNVWAMAQAPTAPLAICRAALLATQSI